MGQLPWLAPPRGQPRTPPETLCCAAAPLGGRTQLWLACALGRPAARPRRTAGCLNRASGLRRHPGRCSGTAQSNANPGRLTMKTRLKQALSGLPPFAPVPGNINAYDLPNRAINLPSYHDMTEAEIGRVLDVLAGVMQ